MKRFIINSLMFLLSIFIILLFVTYLPQKIIQNKAIYKLPPKTKYIVVGHSHPECAFNDSLISSFKNIAQSGESYFHIYQKLKPILNQNKSIKVVFIEYSNNQINKYMDNWIWDDRHMSIEPERLSFMEYEDAKLLMNKNLNGFINLLSLATKKNLSRIIKGNFNMKFGRYLYLVRDKTDSILLNQNNVEKSKLTEYQISEMHLRYLTKIIDYCKSNNVEPILIRSPLHNKYLGFKNEKIYKRILFERFSKIKYFDFSSFPLSNKEFGDLEHLNYKGAKKFSLWFNRILNNGLLYIKNDNGYIQKEIEKVRTHNNVYKALGE